MFYAVNIYDLDKFSDRPLFPPYSLLQPIVTKEVIQAEGRNLPDGDALQVKLDVSPERWQAIIKAIREGFGQRKGIDKAALRLYESKTGKQWKRV